MRTTKLFFAVFALILFASGCKAKPTEAPTTSTRTPVPATKASTSGCTDGASFVADVTVPDGTHFDKGEEFTKTWKIKNSGTCTWGEDYTLVFSSGEQMGAAEEITLSKTAPDDTLEISLDMTSPDADGAYTGNFEIRDASGKTVEIDKGQYLWVTITVGSVTAPPTAPPFSEQAGCTFTENVAFETEMVSLINAARAANGLPALTVSIKLETAAQAHSADMACNSMLSHTGSRGSTLKSRIAAAGYTASYQLENIYAQPPNFGGNPQAAFDWWMGDAIHRDAILSADVTDIGVGYAYVQSSELGGYFTVDFASP